MADNYLEKKYEELQRGKAVVRRSTPSLDSLMKSLSGAGKPSSEYAVKQAQLDAMVRTASIPGGRVSFLTSETVPGERPAVVTASAPRDSAADLGGTVLALRLKAAELHLETCVEYSSDGDSLFACVQVYRN